jgi:hypothetical protein
MRWSTLEVGDRDFSHAARTSVISEPDAPGGPPKSALLELSIEGIAKPELLDRRSRS